MMSRTSRSVAAPGLMFGTGFTEAHTLYIHHVPDAVASPAAAPAREHAEDVVLGAGIAKVPFPVGPDHEAIRLAHFTTTNRAWAIPAIPSGFHASTETVPIKFQHGAHNNLSVSIRCLILLSTYFIYFFIRMDRWTDMYVDLYM